MRLLPALILFALSGQAVAENLSGNELLSICDDATEENAQAGFCAGYVLGAIEGIKWGASAPLLLVGRSAGEAEETGNTLLGFCLPPDATVGQYRDVVLKFLRDSPSERHNSARVLIQQALQGAFPCAP